MAQGTFHIITFGCQMNVNDSFWLARSLQRRGFVESPLEKAEVVILNTCSVRDKPEQKVYAALGRIKYETRRVPGSFAVVAGCVAQQIGAGFFERFPQVRLVVGGDGLAMAPDAIERLHGDPSLRLNLTDFSEIYPERDPALPAQGEGEIPPVAFVNIMQGCDNFCTYCIVPYVRGREKSRKPGDILAEFKSLVEAGYKEITLLGQNVNSYGKGLEEQVDFSDLLNLLCTVPGDYHIRFMTSHPKDASFKLIDTIAAQPKICKHLHLPVQCGSDRLLVQMNRHYTVEHYLELIEYARKKVPGITFSSDIIVGFPGETEEDFQKTLELVQKVGYMQLFTFIYSKRTGTKAADMPDPTPRKEKTDRMTRLLKVQDDIAMALVKAQVGQTVRVLVEGYGRNEGTLSGRLDNNLTVEFKADPALMGSYAMVRLTGARATVLLGELVES